MTSGPLYDNQNEMKLHTEAIRHIARRHHDIPQERVTRLYEFVLMRYKAGAKVKDFLVVLACRRVEWLLGKWRVRHLENIED